MPMHSRSKRISSASRRCTARTGPIPCHFPSTSAGCWAFGHGCSTPTSAFRQTPRRARNGTAARMSAKRSPIAASVTRRATSPSRSTTARSSAVRSPPAGVRTTSPATRAPALVAGVRTFSSISPRATPWDTVRQPDPWERRSMRASATWRRKMSARSSPICARSRR